MQRVFQHFYIVATIFFTLYSQLIIRWKVSSAGELPVNFTEKLFFILNLLINPWVISSIFATLFAGISWMLAMTKFEISYAYPWIALNFLLMMFFGWLFFSEVLTITKIIGTVLVMLGIAIIARG